MLNGLDLFSGIAGNTIGLRQYVKTVAYCESDRYAQSVLLSRMYSADIEIAPIWDDVTTLSGEQFDLPIDIIVGGFPCQDISIAGNGAGLAGKRSGLFYEIIRLTREICPAFVFLENVPAIRTRGLREVIRAFTDIGYDCRWTCVSAAEVGASHLRKRWFLLAANSDRIRVWNKQGRSGRKDSESPSFTIDNGETEPMANSSRKRLERNIGKESSHTKFTEHFREEWWKTEPSVGRVVNGLPNRVDRIKCLGNAVVPKQAKEAFERLIGLNNG